MMKYELAMVEDRGSHYKVMGLTYNTLDNVVNNNEMYLNLSHMAYKKIDQGIQSGLEVRISKTMHASEVMPAEVDIIETVPDDIDAAKQAAIIKARSLITPEISKQSGFVLYDFMMKNNVLASKGYFITDENREEKYIDIIETGDMDLIMVLESFLESKDKLDRANALNKKLDKLQKDLQKLDKVEDINKAADAFITSFYTSS